MTTATIILIIAAIAAFLAYRLGRRHEQIEQRLSALETAERERQQKAHTHRTIAGIEDAQAVAIDLVYEVQIVEARLRNLREILGIVRQGPHSYDPNRECGKRKERNE
jgi:hypothetical protein